MSTPFEAHLARLGRVTTTQLADATLSVGGGDPVPGCFVREPIVSPAGEAGMRARDVRFTCNTADLAGLGVGEGTACSVLFRGETTDWQVAEGGRLDLLEYGQTELTLEEA